MKLWQQHRLTWTLALGVIAYHAYNLGWGEVFDPTTAFKRHTLSIQSGEERVEIPFYEMQRPTGIYYFDPDRRVRAIDGLSRKIAGVGHLAKYWGGQFPEKFISGPRRPLQRLYWRYQMTYQFPIAIPKIRGELVGTLARGSEYFEKRGVQLVAVVPPTGLSFSRQYVRDSGATDPTNLFRRVGNRNEVPGEVYRTILEPFAAGTPDLFAYFSRFQKERPEEPLFGPMESHWSSFGIAVSVLAVLDNLKARGWRIPEARLVKSGSRPVAFDWDLIEHLQLPERYVHHAQEFQWSEPLYRVEISGRVDPPADWTGRILLAGGSHSERLKGTGYALGEQVERLLGGELQDFSKNGNWMGPAMAAISEAGVSVAQGDLLLWEFAIHSGGGDPPKFPQVLRSLRQTS